MNPTIKQRVIGAGLVLSLPVLMHFEGLRLKTYADPVGIPTACFGHTGKEVKAGQTYQPEECDNLLGADLLSANSAINGCVAVPLADHQRSAFASFVYNVGGGKFCGSTIVRKLNAGDYAGACNELPRWIYAQGQKLPGLVRRREAERQLCLGAAA